MTKADDDRDWSYEFGQCQGLEQAAGILLKEAMDAFARGRDDDARTLRALSESIRATSAEREAAARKKYGHEVTRT